MRALLLTWAASSLSLILSLFLIGVLVLREFTGGSVRPIGRRLRRILNLAILPLVVVLLTMIGTKLVNGQIEQATPTHAAPATQPTLPALPSQVAMITLDAIPTLAPTTVTPLNLARTTLPASPLVMTSIPTVLPLPTTSAPTEPDTLVVKDDFSSPTSGWLTRTTKSWEAAYHDGGYQLTLHGQPNIGISSALPAANYRVSVDLAVTPSRAGIVFLAAKPATFYRFMLQGNTYAVQLLHQDTNTSSTVIAWTPSPALYATPGASNRLRVETRGRVVQFFVNEQALATWEIPPGPFVNQFGFALAAPSNQGSATFDNLVVERLAE